jgi:ubiquinone/menaquinone biosynthesis C-methylase UbiE
VSKDELRRSFDRVADLYERARPTYAEDAVDWVAHRLPFGRVADLAAGTGKLTRQLVGRAAEVVAVEPSDAMRAVLTSVVPGVEVLAGEAEAIPLPNESVDAVTVGQAFHWFRVGEALGEMHRVLREGGGYALLWNEWDDDAELTCALNEIVRPIHPFWLRSNEERPEWWPLLRESPLFRGFEEREFRHADRVDADIVAARVASVSALVQAPRDVQERVDADVRALIGSGEVDFQMRTSVVVADRVS